MAGGVAGGAAGPPAAGGGVSAGGGAPGGGSSSGSGRSSGGHSRLDSSGGRTRKGEGAPPGPWGAGGLEAAAQGGCTERRGAEGRRRLPGSVARGRRDPPAGNGAARAAARSGARALRAAVGRSGCGLGARPFCQPRAPPRRPPVPRTLRGRAGLLVRSRHCPAQRGWSTLGQSGGKSGFGGAEREGVVRGPNGASRGPRRRFRAAGQVGWGRGGPRPRGRGCARRVRCAAVVASLPAK